MTFGKPIDRQSENMNFIMSEQYQRDYLDKIKRLNSKKAKMYEKTGSLVQFKRSNTSLSVKWMRINILKSKKNGTWNNRPKNYQRRGVIKTRSISWSNKGWKHRWQTLETSPTIKRWIQRFWNMQRTITLSKAWWNLWNKPSYLGISFQKIQSWW